MDYPLQVAAVLFSVSAAFTIYLQQQGRKNPGIIIGFSTILFGLYLLFQYELIFYIAFTTMIISILLSFVTVPNKEWTNIEIKVYLDSKGKSHVIVSQVMPVYPWGKETHWLIDNPDVAGIKVLNSGGLLQYTVEDDGDSKAIYYKIGSGIRTPSTVTIEYFGGSRSKEIEKDRWRYEDRWYWKFDHETYLSVQLILPPNLEHIESYPPPNSEYYDEGRWVLAWDRSFKKGDAELNLKTDYG
jgi:hypothetical protein